MSSYGSRQGPPWHGAERRPGSHHGGAWCEVCHRLGERDAVPAAPAAVWGTAGQDRAACRVEAAGTVESRCSAHLCAAKRSRPWLTAACLHDPAKVLKPAALRTQTANRTVATAPRRHRSSIPPPRQAGRAVLRGETRSKTGQGAPKDAGTAAARSPSGAGLAGRRRSRAERVCAPGERATAFCGGPTLG